MATAQLLTAPFEIEQRNVPSHRRQHTRAGGVNYTCQVREYGWPPSLSAQIPPFESVISELAAFIAQ
jgi:hypothetical protein